MEGILGKKLGMTQIFNDDGQVVPVTVVKAGPCLVVQRKTVETDGYDAVQLGLVEEIPPRRVTKARRGHFEKAGVGPMRRTAEFAVVDSEEEIEPGDKVRASIFEVDDYVDVVGTSKGKGFQGVMKRHNFKGQGASHGNHKKHRAPGSIGACATPARVFKGMKMAGRMGGERTTVLNLEVVKVDGERGLVMLRGAVPGANGAVVLVREAVKAHG